MCVFQYRQIILNLNDWRFESAYVRVCIFPGRSSRTHCSLHRVLYFSMAPSELRVLNDLMASAYSKSTNLIYKRHVDQFLASSPASAKDIAHHVVYLHNCKYKLSTIRTSLAALASWHKSKGWLDSTKSHEIKTALKGIGKLSVPT